MNATQPIDPTQLPTTTEVWIYGATVQEIAFDCHQWDRIAMTASNDYISVVLNQNCIVMWAGYAKVADYNAIVSGLMWRAEFPYRSNVTFGYVYWNVPQVVDMLVHVATGHVYTSMRGSMKFTPTFNHPAYPASYFCYANGLYPTEITTTYESHEQVRSMVLTDFTKSSVTQLQWLGHTMNQGAGFGVTKGAVMFGPRLKLNQLNRDPLNGQSCIMRSYGGDVTVANCSTQTYAIGCEADSWTMTGMTVRYVTPQAPRNNTVPRTLR
eukprot:TRINITY_DN1499_c0_g1_i1.p1 TRINITY_DN1499_c0_g1~~TRINITY_DN1499_c0_g1_i1.p1  ORF type:complete len:296 (+),score=8.42 TRINITY_DN1499_c0_g1_i1:88-888(+)